jgi:hypothetical protein
MTESLLDPSQGETQLDPNKSYVEQLVGEGKKFKDLESLAKGKYEADLFIESKNRQFDALSDEYQQLRSTSNASSKLQELIDRLETQRQQTPVTDNTKVNEPEAKNAFDPSQLDSLITNKFQQMESQRTQTQNFNTVKERLQSQFGSRFPEIVAAQTQKLGLNAEKVDEMAKTSPEAFFRLMGLNEVKPTQTFQTPPRSSQRNDSFSPTGNTRKWSHWKGLLKTQPNLFSDPKSHNQMMEDIKAVGEANFYDTP